MLKAGKISPIIGTKIAGKKEAAIRSNNFVNF